MCGVVQYNKFTQLYLISHLCPLGLNPYDKTALTMVDTWLLLVFVVWRPVEHGLYGADPVALGVGPELEKMAMATTTRETYFVVACKSQLLARNSNSFACYFFRSLSYE